MKVHGLAEWGKTDLMATVGKVREFCDGWAVDIIAIDDTGVGGAVTDRLDELYSEGEIDFEILPVNFGMRADEDDDFKNKGSEIWWRIHETMNPATEEPLSLPRNHPLMPKLASQLQKAQYELDSRERIWVDKTGSRRSHKRVGDPEPPSPDLADALALALEAWSQFWGEPKKERQYYGRSFLNRG